MSHEDASKAGAEPALPGRGQSPSGGQRPAGAWGPTLNQHLIDPEICIRCNTCEATCPVGAITHDDRNYVVDPAKCQHCMDCVAPCPTGSIDHWRERPASRVYTLAEQLLWDELPAQDDAAVAAPGPQSQPATAISAPEVAVETIARKAPAAPDFSAARYGATRPPWSAAQATTLFYGPGARASQPFITATVTGNVRVTEAGLRDGEDYDTHHLVLDFGTQPFALLEGQSIAVLPPGCDARGVPHHARQYSVASPRNGERPGYNNASLTVKRVLRDHQDRPVRGVASNFLCDLAVGDTVQVIGPFGNSFLMPNHPGSHIVMICTGTGSAPMRAMTEWRRRQPASAAPGAADPGRLMLFFGARSAQELPYFGPLQRLPKDFIDIHFAFSRSPDETRRYVQDAMREQAAELTALLQDDLAHFYVCGLKAMEEGVLRALHDIAQGAALDWERIAADLKAQGRLHLETY